MTIERRTIPVSLRAEEGTESPRIVGHAALFNSLSSDLGGFREQIMPGAFTDAIGSSDVRALFNHDPNMVLGRAKAGTLALAEDEAGLRVEIDPPDTSFARDLLVSMRRGDIDQMSFGFIVAQGGSQWEETEQGVIRTITKVAELFDVSPVTYPAYPETSVAVRSLGEWKAAREAVATPPADEGYAVALAERHLRLRAHE